MKKKFLTALSFITLAALGSTAVFAGETLDVPQNTSVEQTDVKNIADETVQNAVDVEKPAVKTSRKWFQRKKTQDKTKSSDQNEQNTLIQEAETADEVKTAPIEEEAEKTEKSKKFFSKAEKTPKKDSAVSAEEQGPTTDVIVDSETIEYFPERHEFEAIGDAKVTFPSENSVLLADKIVFNHDTNYIKGYGNVVLIKEGQKVNGDYIQVDLNEDNAMMSHPVLNHMAIKLRAKKGIVSDAQTEALDGVVTFNDKTSYKFTSRPIMGFENPMMDDAIPKNFYFKEKYDNKWRLKAKTIIIDSYKDHDVATLKNADIYIQNVKLASAGKLKLYTDKEQQYIETNMLELGSLRNIGAFVSPGLVFKTPNSSTLKIGPALTYGSSEIGAGALGRFLTDKNRTDFGWASSNSKFVVRGRQQFTEDLSLQYGINSYLNNGFLGGRMPEYGFQFLHQKTYNIEDLGATFNNRFSAGFAKDWKRDYSTTKFAWQTMTNKSLFKYKNEDNQFALDFGLNVQTHAALYGNGSTMGIVRAGPYFRTQYRSWQQYIAYFQGGQAGDSPMYYDKNFYGKSNVVLGESLRLCKYLTLMYTATIALSDTPNDKMLQENRFWAAIGPDDVKFLIGYDAYRQNASMGLMMNVGAENSDVEFRRLILNDPQAIGQHDKKERERMAAQKKKAEAKKKESDPMNRSVKDYSDYNPGFNMMPGAIIQPSMIRPPGM